MVRVVDDRELVPFTRPESFLAWGDRQRASGTLPVVAVAGSRGKSTVVRLLDAIFRAAGLRTATWTDAGVEIDGRRQSGELRPWSRAMARLGDGTLDIAVQELDWSTVHAVGLPERAYPVIVVTNLCGNNESCLAQPESRRAATALSALLGAVRTNGTLILNGDDMLVAASEADHVGPVLQFAHRPDGPILRAHLANGGSAAWVDDDALRFGNAARAVPIIGVAELPFALRGIATFEIQNALAASATAFACGVEIEAIATALRRFSIPGWLMPGSFNVLHVGETVLVVDRPAPPWFLRSTLRAALHLPHHRFLVVAGPMPGLGVDHMIEVGRLIGRAADAVMLHSDAEDADHADAIRRGVVLNDVPPVVISVPTERQAINRMLKHRRSTDVVLVLADRPAAVLRTLARLADDAHANRQLSA